MFWRAARYDALESQYARRQAAVFQRVLPGRPIPPVAEIGMDKGFLSRLENGHQENVTFATLERLARAFRKRLEFRLVEDEAPVA